jgi:hypothetical protein
MLLIGPLGGYNKTNVIWSISKAWTATLIGTAERDGKLSTSNLMIKYVPEWNNVKSDNITMENVLRHNSGRCNHILPSPLHAAPLSHQVSYSIIIDYDVVTDFVTPQLEQDQTTFGIKLPQEYAPGK